MKKILLIFIFALLVSGCGKQKLICTKKDMSNKELIINEKVEVAFRKQRAFSIENKITVVAEGLYQKHMDALMKSFTMPYEERKNVSLQKRIDKNKIVIQVKTNLKDENKDGFLAITSENTKKETEKLLEKSNYKCSSD